MLTTIARRSVVGFTVAALAAAVACSGATTGTPRPLPTAAIEAPAQPEEPGESIEPGSTEETDTVFVTAVPTTPPPPGSRENPVPLGETAALGDGWTLVVLQVVPDATADVLAENQFNEPPAESEQFFLVKIAMTFDGVGSADVQAGLRLRLVGRSAVAYTTYNDSCGVVPGRLPETEVFEGGTVTGNVCWSVKSSDVGSLVLFDDSQDIGTDDRVFFSLEGAAAMTTPPPMVVPTATPDPAPPSGAAGTREDPIPLGEVAALGDGWRLAVTGAVSNATETVLAENQFNKPPVPGRQFYLVTVSATYESEGSAIFERAFRLALVGSAGVSYRTFNQSCGVIPAELPVTEVFEGGVTVGNLCWSVPSEEIGSLLLFDDPLTASEPGPCFALHE